MQKRYTRFCLFSLVLIIALCVNINLAFAVNYHFNLCNETSSFSYDTGYDINPSIRSPAPEGNNYIRFNNHAISDYPHAPYEYHTLTFNDYPDNNTMKVLGFWYRLIWRDLIGGYTGLAISFQELSGIQESTRETFSIAFLADEYFFLWNGYKRKPPNQAGDEILTNTWYWIEMYSNGTDGNFYFGIDGEYWNDNFSGTHGSTLTVNMSVIASKNIGEMDFDYIRISDNIEYPPTTPLFEVETLIYLDGEVMTENYNPIRIAGSSYGTGETISLAYGEYDLACVHNRLDFVSWNVTGYESGGYFGYNQIGYYNTTTLNNKKMGAYGQNYTIPYAVNVTHISAYTHTQTSQTNGTYGIYQIQGHDVANAVLMGSTQEYVNINTTMIWRTFTFTGGLLLEAGSYMIVQHTAGNGSTPAIRGRYDASSVDNFQGTVNDTYSDGLESIFGAGGSNISSTIVSVYAVYEYVGLSVDNGELAETTLIVHGSGVLVLYVIVSLPDIMNQYTWIAMLIAALSLMIWSPSWFAWKIKKVGVTVESIERLGYAMLLFLVGFGLLVMCIYS